MHNKVFKFMKHVKIWWVKKDFYELNKYSVKTHKQSCFIQNYGYFAA